jgi:dienelactone hydrolase
MNWNRVSRRFLQFVISGISMLVANAAMAYDVTPINVSFVNAQGITIPARLFKPTGNGPYPVIVMAHGCAGANSTVNTANAAPLYREWGDRLVAAGYVALLPDSFTPRGSSNECGNGSAGVSEITDRPQDMHAAYTYLSTLSYVDIHRAGLMGWSHGGSTTLATMEQSQAAGGLKRFKVAASFYPGCGMFGAFGGLTSSTSTWLPYAPLDIHMGSADSTVDPAYCTVRVNKAQQLGASVATGNPTSLTLYADAEHSFDQTSSSAPAADVAAKAAADPATMALFNKHLKYPATAVLDGFNGANGPIPSTFAGGTSALATYMVSNQKLVGGGGYITWGTSFGANQEVRVKLSTLDPASWGYFLTLKSSNTNWHNEGAIHVAWYDREQAIKVMTYHSTQGWVTHGSTLSISLQGNDVLGAQATSDGKVKVYRNGLIVGTWNIATWPNNASGGYVGVTGGTPNMAIDDFAGGTIVN